MLKNLRNTAPMKRFLPQALLLLIAVPALAAEKTPVFLDHPMSGIYSLMALAIVQMIIIMVIAGAIKNLGREDGILDRYLKERREHSMPFFVLFSTPTLAATITNENLMWLLVVVNLFLFFYTMILIGTLRSLIKTLNGPETEEEVVVNEPAMDLNKVLNNAVPIEQEHKIMLDHDYDGIRELDNVLPPWWLWMFYASIIFAVGYMLNYHVFNTAPLQHEEYLNEMAEGKAEVQAYLDKMGGLVTEQTVTLMDDDGDLSAGKGIFTANCVACHSETGAGYPGSVGPNLVDKYWIHGGGIVNLFKTIKYGVPEKGMISWKAQLKPKQIQQVASYIISLEGTTTEGGKEPQGPIWSPEGDVEEAAPDSTGTEAVVAGLQQ